MANVGDRVLICDGYWEDKVLKDTFKPLYGTVEKQYQSEDRSHHGRPMYDTITVVRGEDGKIYTDDSEKNYTQDWKKTPVFLTEQEFTNAIQHAIWKKEKIIYAANADIDLLKKQLASFQKSKTRVDLIREDSKEGKSFSNSFLVDANVKPTVDLFKVAVHDYIQFQLARGQRASIWEDFHWGDAMHQVPKEIWNKYGIEPVMEDARKLGAPAVILKVDNDEILLPSNSPLKSSYRAEGELFMLTKKALSREGFLSNKTSGTSKLRDITGQTTSLLRIKMQSQSQPIKESRSQGKSDLRSRLASLSLKCSSIASYPEALIFSKSK